MQKVVNFKQSLGKAGTWASDAIRSELVYQVKGSSSVAAVAAKTTISFGANAAADDTITINGQVYTFTSDPDQSSFLVSVGSAAAATATAFANAVNATNPFVSASASTTTVTLTARQAGVGGNGITVVSSNPSITASAMSGGADATFSNNATFGYAFTLAADGVSAQMGGTGAYVGIMVNPENVALYGGLNPTLQVPDGTVAGMARSGYIYAVLSNASNVGDKVYFTQATGALSAGTASASQTQIDGATVVQGGEAGETVILELK